ncbi:Ger(x)C family spore germination protein [Paenibacillus apiarius]|uniref:Ger(x)C family spore germination protein n=1 Tax=Paenibacillus apiarius TaxID=46240 RepID=UPI001981A174|nr:Ger(x)C family spore germination protein [Paenibacillus apiarius]MBN3524672.1 Ger(x)C family spore germination protein [Paenibacillus apiarius]
MMRKAVRQPCRYAVSFGIVMLMLTTLTGCWDRTELEQLSIILAAGLDSDGNGGVKMTLQVFVPKEGGSGGQQSGGEPKKGGEGGGQTTVFSASGPTLGHVLFDLQNKMPRYIFWGHAEVYVISKELASKGVLEHFDFFQRFQSPRERALIFVADGQASEFLKSPPQLQNTVAELFEDLGKSRAVWNISLLEMVKMLSGDSGTAYAPFVEWSNSELGVQVPSVNQLAIIKKDRYIGGMSGEDMLGVMILRGEKRLSVSYCSEGETAHDCLTLRLRQNRIDIEPRWDGRKLTMRIKIFPFMDAIQNNSQFDVSNAAEAHKAQLKANQKIKRIIDHSIMISQTQWQADVFGFAKYVHRKYAKEWNRTIKQNWERIYKDMDTEITVESLIVRPGSIRENLKKVGER